MACKGALLLAVAFFAMAALPQAAAAAAPGVSYIRSCSEAQTGEDTRKIIDRCGEFFKIPGPVLAPSEGCCAPVRGAGLECVCNLVTPGLEKGISMVKLVYTARLCQSPLPAGTHCGDYQAAPGNREGGA